MKLLFEHNLSPKLVERLADVFPGSKHVRNLNLHRADDAQVWEYARINALAIVSKDEDFHQLSFLHGPPPKVVWVRMGNGVVFDPYPFKRESTPSPLRGGPVGRDPIGDLRPQAGTFAEPIGPERRKNRPPPSARHKKSRAAFLPGKSVHIIL